MIDGGIVGSHYNNPLRGATKVFYRSGQTQRVATALDTTHQLGSGARVIPWNTVANEVHHNGHLFSVEFPAGTNADHEATVSNAFFQPHAGTYDIFIEGITSANNDRDLTLTLRKIQEAIDDTILFINTIPGRAQGRGDSKFGNTFFAICKNLVVDAGDVFYFVLDGFANNAQSRVTAAMTLEKTV